MPFLFHLSPALGAFSSTFLCIDEKKRILSDLDFFPYYFFFIESSHIKSIPPQVDLSLHSDQKCVFIIFIWLTAQKPAKRTLCHQNARFYADAVLKIQFFSGF